MSAQNPTTPADAKAAMIQTLVQFDAEQTKRALAAVYLQQLTTAFGKALPSDIIEATSLQLVETVFPAAVAAQVEVYADLWTEEQLRAVYDFHTANPWYRELNRRSMLEQSKRTEAALGDSTGHIMSTIMEAALDAME